MTELTLRAMEPEDIDTIYRWENDPDIWVYSAVHQPFSRNSLQKFIDEYSLLDIYTSRQMRLVAAEQGGKACGCIDLYDFEPLHRRAAVGIMVDKTMRGTGIGTRMLRMLEDFVRQHLDLHMLYCDISIDNTASIRLFEKNGFKPCGIMHDWMLDSGRWTDAKRYQKIIK
ncbi:MAG: GNAT family N-acetyltransferase [Bacteroidales bacterium]|nr:GNAT family N-acetyltransferase [Bacteroidales bacterium]